MLILVPYGSFSFFKGYCALGKECTCESNQTHGSFTISFNNIFAGITLQTLIGSLQQSDILMYHKILKVKGEILRAQTHNASTLCMYVYAHAHPLMCLYYTMHLYFASVDYWH